MIIVKALGLFQDKEQKEEEKQGEDQNGSKDEEMQADQKGEAKNEAKACESYKRSSWKQLWILWIDVGIWGAGSSSLLFHMTLLEP